MRIRHLMTVLTVIFLTTRAMAMVTELGLSYGYAKKTFDASNYYQTDSKTASLSLYFFEKWALEFSYTDFFYESQESDTSSTRTVQQSSQISDSSIVYMMLDKKSMVQPYVKVGGAYIKKSQKVRYLNSSVIDTPESAGWGPSYGVGLKFVLSETFSIKLGYEAWQTPLGDGTNSEDNSFKAGISWYL